MTNHQQQPQGPPRQGPFSPLRIARMSKRRATAQRAPMMARAGGSTERQPDAGQIPPLAVNPARTGFAGRVFGLEQRMEQDLGTPTIVVSFRLARWTREQQPLPHLSVEMRGTSLKGSISDFDWVQLPPSYNPNRPIARLTNLTTGQTVEMHGFRRQQLLARLLYVFFAAIFLFIVVLVLSHL